MNDTHPVHFPYIIYVEGESESRYHTVVKLDFGKRNHIKNKDI